MDLLDMLKKDHQTVTKLFQRFKDQENARMRNGVVRKICDELDVHARVEEELFYPAVAQAGDAELDRMVGEARQEHEQVKQQVQTLREAVDGGEADDLAGRVASLQQDVEHHVTEEEGEMFPRVEEAIDGAERAEMGRRVGARKRELAGPTAGVRAASGRRTPSGATKRRQGRTRSSTRKRTRRAKSAKTTRGRRRTTGAKKRARS